MNLRSLVALLLLVNYLLLAGAGCVSRPEQDPFIVLIQAKSDESRHYESTRYMRTDALEAFMAEALATRYQDKGNPAPHQVHTLVNSVDTHVLPAPFSFQFYSSCHPQPAFSKPAPGVAKSVAFIVHVPPELQLAV